MKRSEMLEIITDELWDSFANISDIRPHNAEGAAMVVLSLIEEAGMLPPSKIESTGMGSFECQIENFRICEKSTYDEIPFKWEDE